MIACELGPVRRDRFGVILRRTFCAAINQGLQAFRVLCIDHPYKCGVDPASRFDRVESTNNYFELHVVVLAFVLYLANKRSYFDTLDSPFYKGGSDFSLRFSNISLPE